MTTPKGRTSAPATDQDPAKADERIRRPETRRSQPNRAATGSSVSGAYSDGPSDPAGIDELSMSESVAHAVRSGYDVIAENIQQGREAAARFRQGEYNIRDVPGDLEVALSRLLHLARELSTTTFDVFERMLKELRSLQPPDGGGGNAVPPFRSPAATKAPEAVKPDSGRMKLTVRFTGEGKAATRTVTLERPRRPTAPGDLTATPLAARDAGSATISDVTFEMDVSVEGLVAVVPVPATLPPGVYSGLVYARNDEVPLGVLSVEVGK